MSGGYISFFANSAYFGDAELQNALPDFQSQVSNEFNYYWGLFAYLDDSGGGSPIVVTDYGGDPTTLGYLGYHSIDGNYNPYAIIYGDVCAYYNTPITGVISHEMLEMLADQLTSTVALYDYGNGTGVIVDQEVCDPCEMSLYYEGPNGNIVSDFVTPAWFVPGDLNPPDFLGAIAGPWQLASGGYVCYQDVTLSGLICVAGDNVPPAFGPAGTSIKRVDNPGGDLIKRRKAKGRHIQSPQKPGDITVVKRKSVPQLAALRQTPRTMPQPLAGATRVPTNAQVVPNLAN